MAQKVYTKRDLGYYYLNPYVKQIVKDGRIYLYNSLFSTGVVLSGDYASVELLLQRLKTGVPPDRLQDFVREAGTDVKVLISNGIIE